MIVLDLEWNRGYDKTPLDEILQIGAVRLDRPGGRVTGTFCAFIRPRVHRRLNRTARELPEVAVSLDSDLDFSDAYHSFRRWCRGETEFAAWGADDLDILARNCAFWELDLLPVERLYDIQTAFSLTLGTRQNIALWWAVEYCQIPECFTYHNALHDCVYTAMVSGFLPAQALELSLLSPQALRFASVQLPVPPPRPVGPFPSLKAGLDARDARRARCPLCGSPFLVQSWQYHTEESFYVPLRCPLHGRFLTRLTLAPAPDGQWRGALEVPPITPELLADYDAACRSGLVYLCKSSKRHRRRGHWRRPPKNP